LLVMISRYAGQHRPGYPQIIGYQTRRGPPMLAGNRSRCQPKETVMNPVRLIRRLGAVLAGLLAAGAGALLAVAAASPALAMTAGNPVPDLNAGVPEPWPGANLPTAPVPAAIHTVTRTVVVGGMPGWQIALIAVGAALLAAALAVLADRAHAAHHTTALPAA
jgi:hypothetical protein